MLWMLRSLQGANNITAQTLRRLPGYLFVLRKNLNTVTKLCKLSDGKAQMKAPPVLVSPLRE